MLGSGECQSKRRATLKHNLVTVTVLLRAAAGQGLALDYLLVRTGGQSSGLKAGLPFEKSCDHAMAFRVEGA